MRQPVQEMCVEADAWSLLNLGFCASANKWNLINPLWCPSKSTNALYRNISLHLQNLKIIKHSELKRWNHFRLKNSFLHKYWSSLNGIRRFYSLIWRCDNLFVFPLKYKLVTACPISLIQRHYSPCNKNHEPHWQQYLLHYKWIIKQCLYSALRLQKES